MQRTFLDGRHIVIQPDGVPAPLQASGRGRGQHVMKPVLKTYLGDVGVAQKTRLAREYVASPYKNRRIVMNPEVHFGQPFVDRVGPTAQRLADAVLEEACIEYAAMAFGVGVDDVAAAHYSIESLKRA